ncbi:MAG: hypothetical protein R2708_10495 [Vicinamibacterales bacterium]
MKALAIGFAILVAALVAGVTWRAWGAADTTALGLGNFMVLGLTLVVLVWYAYDTNSIARVTRDRWIREGVLTTAYSMELVGEKGQAGRTLVRIHNPSSLVVRARVNFNLCVYGQPVESGSLYDGEQLWLVFPQQVSQGWFEIESVLQRRGKTVLAMIAECTPANREHQLTARLELEFQDELGGIRTLPARPHYFDFDRWAWIPRLADGS